MIHDLSDSPKYDKDIIQIFFSNNAAIFHFLCPDSVYKK